MKLKSNFLSIFAVFALSMAATSTAWAAQRTLESDGNGGFYINMPATGTDELVIPDNVTSFKVYDDGGAEGGYTPNSDGFLVLTAPEGRLLRLTGSTGAVNSYLYVYDGSDESNYLFSKTGFKDVGRTLSSGRNLLLEFSTSSVVTDGLYLEVTVVNPAGPHMVVINDTEHGSIFASPEEADAGTTISLTITPEEGYYLDKINVTDEYNNSLSYDDYGNPVNGFSGGKWYSGGVASFTMPRTDAIVRSTFYSIDKYLDLQMPSTGELPVIIPNSVSTFLIRPDYYGTENNTIVLTAPEGKILQIMSEDMTNSGDDSLYVYDGTDENATLLKKSLAREIGRPISTQHVMALHYKGDGKYRSRDAFRVTVLDPSVYNNVTVTNNAGGTVTPSVSSATANTSVTLTATPNEGYMLDYVEAFDAEGLKVDVSNATWYESGEMLFKMPGSAVKVKPVFVRVEDGPSINMLKNGTFSFAIPEGIEKIHIYDDGGKDGNFSSNSKGYLALSAPKGKKLRLGGSVELRSGYNTGHLTVYDGVDDNASELLDRYSINTDIPTKLSAGSNIFVYFYATYGSCQGLDLTVTVVDPNAPHAINIVSVDNGSFINLPTEATPGTVVTLTASPNSGYFFNNVKIQDEYSTDSYEGNVDYTGGWYTNNTISFTMPQTEVTITPSFDYIQYADVVVKKSGTESISIPDEIKSFELNVGYSEDAIESSILLTAPEGKILQIQGEVAPRTGLDSLYVYDGADISATELLKVAASASVSKNSSGQNMLLHYMELGEDRGFGTGLSLRVSVVDPNHEYTVSIFEEIENGSVEVNKASAKFNTPVTVTATPAENYFLNKIEVRGKDSWNPVAVTGGTWYSSNEAIFAMPPEDAITRATFVNELSADAGLSITMPIYEPLRVTVPNGVQSFEIEGEDIGYNRASQPLILTAPEGYLFQLEGYVNESDFGMGFNAYQGEFVNPVGSNAQLMSGETMTKKMTLVHVASGDGPSFMRVRLVSEWETGIKIPKSGSVTMNIPEGIDAFIVYDDGGYYGDYSNNSDGSLTLTAPEGYGLMVGGGTYVADTGDSLIVYDGINTSAAVIAKASFNQSAWTMSSGRSMTLRFKSNDDGKAYGPELSVMVVKSSASFAAVSVYEGEDNSKIAAVYGDYSGKEKVNIPNSIDVDYIAYIREFTPNVPSTIVLPFSLPEGAETNGKFYYLKEVAQVKGEYKWKATFRNITLDKASALPAANTPYAVIVDDEELWFGFEDSQATLQTSEIAKQNDNTGKWIFEGSYEYKTWESDDPELGLAYALAAEDDPDGAYTAGQYVKIGAGSYATPMRAYMSKINSSVRLSRPLAWGETSYISSMELPESIDVEFIDEEEKPMAVGRMNTVTGEFKIDRWYDLKGRSTNKKPSTKGAFYNKRVIAK